MQSLTITNHHDIDKAINLMILQIDLLCETMMTITIDRYNSKYDVIVGPNDYVPDLCDRVEVIATPTNHPSERINMWRTETKLSLNQIMSLKLASELTVLIND